MSGDEPRESDVESRLPSRRLMAWVSICFLIGTIGVAVAIMGTVPVSDGVSLQAPDGMNATLTGATDAQLENPFPTSGTVEWTTEAGNISFFSSGSAAATVHKDDIEGTWTTVTAITADPNTITIDPGDKDSVVVGQEIQSVAWRSGIAADDSTVDFSYTADGPARVTVQGVPSSTRLAAVDASSGQVLDETTSSGGGAVTFDSLPDGDRDVQIQTFDPNTPQFDNADPTGETSSAPTEVSVDVADGDFPRGDSVTVTIDVDGSQVHTETISSNQTVTASVPSSAQTGGTHSWSVSATDSYGESNSDSYQYVVPKNLTIYDEETLEVIDDQQVNLTVYTRGDDPEILNFTTNDGDVDLGAGFPSSEPFVVVAESEGYLDRRIFVESLYDTQRLYLLNESVQHTELIFGIEDYSGNFPPSETVLQVQRGINDSWETILGDYFGANDQFTAQIKYNTRHRLVLVNSETGERRVLGTYTPLTSGTETLTVSPGGELDLPDTHPSFTFSPSVRTVPDNSSVDLSAGITPGDIALQDWEVNIYHVDGATNNTLYSESSSDSSGGDVSTAVDLSGRDGSVKVVTSYTLEGGTHGSRVATYSINAGPTESMSFLDGVVGLIGLVPGSDSEMVLSLTAMVLTVVGTAAVGSRYRMSSEGMGLVTLALVAAFAILGWVDYSLLFIVLVLFASLTFLRRRY